MKINNIKIISEADCIIEVEFSSIDQKIIDNVSRVTPHFVDILCKDKEKPERTAIPFYDVDKTFLKEILHKLLSLDAPRIDRRWPIEFFICNKPDRTEWINKLSQKGNGIELIICPEGYSQSFHKDNRFVMFAGMINVKQNIEGTLFFNNLPKKLNMELETDFKKYNGFVHSASPKQNVGTFWLNTDTQWHGINKITEERHILLITGLVYPPNRSTDI
jgi:hypothetical protein